MPLSCLCSVGSMCVSFCRVVALCVCYQLCVFGCWLFVVVYGALSVMWCLCVGMVIVFFGVCVFGV